MSEHKRHCDTIERIFRELRTLKVAVDLPEMVKYIRYPEGVHYDPHLLIGTSYEVVEKDDSQEPYIHIKIGNRVCARPAYCFKAL